MKIIELKGWIYLQRTLILHPTDSTKLGRAFLNKESRQKGMYQGQQNMSGDF